VERFIENPYWSRLGGMVLNTFGIAIPLGQHEFPIDPSSMSRWRQRVGKEGMKKLFKELLQTAKRTKQLKRSDLNHVNVDTTVQEKAIAFPIRREPDLDGQMPDYTIPKGSLWDKMREALVKAAESRGIPLRQSYRRLSKRALVKQSRYVHAQQMKRARRMTRRLKTYFQRRLNIEIQGIRSVNYTMQVSSTLRFTRLQLFSNFVAVIHGLYYRGE